MKPVMNMFHVGMVAQTIIILVKKSEHVVVLENPRCPNVTVCTHPWRLGGCPHPSLFVLFVYVFLVTVSFKIWNSANGGGWDRIQRSWRRRPCLSHMPDCTSWTIDRGAVEAVRMLEAGWIVDEVVIMASSSNFCKDACMWNEPLADY
ncbi:hypothetical protein Ahy_A09g042306 isoform B [Arachis hypogaea]|uniref:Uncharacterized protein n=1 Tax=Arachis hypogaea TaxID=3818 RepID=A0A445BFI6_ARAHY|nr:hypothetical protein Ahy_A09g042306 isoform B [Arachis hypogaea]